MSVRQLCLLVLIQLVSGQQYCKDSSDCSMRLGATCQNSECICLTKGGNYLVSCPSVTFGQKCSSDMDCGQELICEKSDRRFCKCPRDNVWDRVSNRCYITHDNNDYVNKKYDLTRDVIIPSIILVSLTITASLCYRLFCTRGSWRRRRCGNEMARALEETQVPVVATSQPTATWIASYRVFGTVERSGPPCILLPLGPPPYEEALKHKVVLSSYHPPLVHTTPL